MASPLNIVALLAVASTCLSGASAQNATNSSSAGFTATAQIGLEGW